MDVRSEAADIPSRRDQVTILKVDYDTCVVSRMATKPSRALRRSAGRLGAALSGR